METVLEVKDLTKLYKNNRGISNLTFEIGKGDVLGLLGPNGSGKTTSMKVMCGLCHADRGEIKIFNHSVYDNYEQALSKVGCLIEMPALYEYLTVGTNLKMMARLYQTVTEEKIDHILEVVGLTKYKKERVSRFSLGMKQRLGLAMALISEPELVILDEPANGLDIEGMIEIREIISRMAEKYGTAFVISSHLAGEIEKTCNKVAVIYEGEMLSFETMEQALQLSPTLEDYFLTKVREKRGVIAI